MDKGGPRRVHVLAVTQGARACAARLQSTGYDVVSYTSAMEIRIDEAAQACDAWVIPLEGDGERAALWLCKQSARIVVIDPRGGIHRAYEFGAVFCASSVEGVVEAVDFTCNGLASFARPNARSKTRLVPQSGLLAPATPMNGSTRIVPFPSRT